MRPVRRDDSRTVVAEGKVRSIIGMKTTHGRDLVVSSIPDLDSVIAAGGEPESVARSNDARQHPGFGPDDPVGRWPTGGGVPARDFPCAAGKSLSRDRHQTATVVEKNRRREFFGRVRDRRKKRRRLIPVAGHGKYPRPQVVARSRQVIARLAEC